MADTGAGTMRAARFYGPSKIQIDHIPIPPAPLPHEVTIAPLWAGICGTDLHEYICGPISIATLSHPHPMTHEHFPVTLGHEFCGTISALPPGYTGPLMLGTNVMVDPRLNCTDCPSCRSGTENLCDKWGFIGLHGGGGGGAGFSEFVNVSQRMCYALPESVNMDHAVLIEPLAVGRHALRASGIEDSRWSELDVLVLGGGPVGLATLYNLRALGVKRVFVSEPTSKRREMVVDLGLAGVENVLDPLTSDVPVVLSQKIARRHVDVTFDCSGVPLALEAGMEALGAKGVYVNVAGWEKPVSLFAPFILQRITQPGPFRTINH